MGTATTLDYIGYFFKGYKTEAMDQTVLAVLRSIHYVIIAFLGAALSSVLSNVAHGKDLWDLATWQTAITAGAIYVLGLVNEFVRKQSNPSVSVKALPDVEFVPHVESAPQAVSNHPVDTVPPER